MMAGAVIGGAVQENKEKLKEIERCASCIGLAFQIQDDILDETSSEEVLGKTVHSDAKNEKTTYVSLYGLEYAKNEVKRLSLEAKNILKNIESKCGNSEVLEKIIDKLTDRKS